MRLEREDTGVERIATVDIETTHFKPKKGEVVAIGVGVHERGQSGREATYECLTRREYPDEAALIRTASEQLSKYDANLLVTYNGDGFDIPFLGTRLEINGVDSAEFSFSANTHLDLFPERKRRADERGKKWPKLEECLEAYGVTPAKTHWNGEQVTNDRFGDELGPAYLEAIATGNGRENELRDVIEHYLVSDLESNYTVFYGDIGVDFDPVYDGQLERF